MDVLGNYESLEEFEFRDRHVEIMMADHGAVCCNVQHEYADTACSNCGSPIEPYRVLLILIDGTDLGVPFTALDLSDAIEFAKQYIEDLDEGDGNGGEDDDGDDEGGDDDDSTPSIPLPPFTGRPPRKPRKPGRKKKQDPMSGLIPNSASNLDEVIEKLGWPQRGLQIIREVGGKKKG